MASRVEERPSARDFFSRQRRLFEAGFSFSGYERDLLALSRGDGTFLDVSGVSGIDSVSDGRAAVHADFDNDGDLDVFLRAMHGRAHYLFRNDVGHEAGWLRIDLEGRRSGRDAFGAVVRVKTPTGVHARLRSGGTGFLAQHDRRLLFGLGDEPRADWIEVTWPSGLVQRWSGAEADAVAGASLRIVEGAPRPVRVAERTFRLPDPVPEGRAAWNALALQRGDRFPDLHLVRVRDGSALPPSRVPAPALVSFWATWCGPCRRELPELEAFAERAGLPLLAVSVDDESTRGRIPAFLRAVGYDGDAHVASQRALESVYPGGKSIVPLIVLLDSEGRIEDAFLGWSRAARERVSSAVASSTKR